ncbi:uncharacterized protein [Argopecten irradians]|uniref:uncharacterized protein n=1 Tax=Argopecten irradians TaxID=31199 RepID=UPI0037142429
MVSLRMSPLYVVFVFALASVVHGHGRMLDPPGRSSMWRVGFNTPVNFDDNGLNCGYKEQPLDFFRGNCGVCGDPSDQEPKQNEAGGKYATGIISKYYKMGEVIDIQIDITTNDGGFFEFRLCENNDVSKPITRSCLKHVLVHPVTGETQYPVKKFKHNIAVPVKLPENVTCSQCVLQWRYHTGKNGKCKTCVDQEEFYACSDIAIKARGSPTIPIETGKQGSALSPLVGDKTFGRKQRSSGRCYSISRSTDDDRWCAINCNHSPPHCPTFLCRCTTPTTTKEKPTLTTAETTTTTASLPTVPKTTSNSLISFLRSCVSLYPSVSSYWCNINCNYSPIFCPAYMCKCTKKPSPTTPDPTTTTTPIRTTTTTPIPTTTITPIPTTTITPIPTTVTTTVPTTSYPFAIPVNETDAEVLPDVQSQLDESLSN